MDLHKTNFQPIYNEASVDHDIPIDKISYGNAGLRIRQVTMLPGAFPAALPTGLVNRV